MKWLIIQSDGMHAKNRSFRECHALRFGLQMLGHHADVWGLRHPNFPDTPDFESYDVIFCAEQYEFDWLPNFQSIRKPLKIQWIVDLHVHQNYPIDGFHLAAHATKSLMNGYRAPKNIWFPNAVDDRLFYPKSLEKRINMAFVGSRGGNRADSINRLERECGLQCFQAIGEDMLQIISSAKIHFNQNNGPDINYRTFETIGMGVCLLTNYDPDLERLGFIDGVNCLTYRNFEECVSKYRDAIYNRTWEKIGERGHKLSVQNTYTARLYQLIMWL